MNEQEAIDRLGLNYIASQHPKAGDYWHERFSPYFLVVSADAETNQYTVLSCIGEDTARRDNGDGTWSFDYSRYRIVNRDWIRKTVTYSFGDEFVADVIRSSEKTKQVVREWKEFRTQQLLNELKKLGPEVGHYILSSEW
jgi:hypothetical protein